MTTRAVIATISAVLVPAIITGCGSDTTAPTPPPLSWLPTPSGTNQNLLSVFGTGKSDVWAVGDGAIVHFDGTAWSNVVTGTSLVFSNGSTGQRFNAVWASSPTDVWAVGSDWSPQDIVIHFDGSKWSTVPVPTFRSYLTGIWGSSSSDIWAVARDGSIIHYDGNSWTTSPTGDLGFLSLEAIRGTSASDVWAVGHQTILHYDGTSWSRQSGAVNTLDAVWSVSAGDAWAVGVPGVLHYNGTTWSNVASEVGVPDVPRAVWGASPLAIWSVTANSVSAGGGKIAYFDGRSWKDVTPGPLENLHGIWGSSATDIWVVGDNGTILRGVVVEPM